MTTPRLLTAPEMALTPHDLASSGDGPRSRAVVRAGGAIYGWSTKAAAWLLLEHPRVTLPCDPDAKQRKVPSPR